MKSRNPSKIDHEMMPESTFSQDFPAFRLYMVFISFYCTIYSQNSTDGTTTISVLRIIRFRSFFHSFAVISLALGICRMLSTILAERKMK